MAEENLIFTGPNGKYGRTYTETTLQLSAKINNGYKSKNAIITTSGMAAISTCVQGIFLSTNPNDVAILCDNELYSDVPHTFEWLRLMYAPRIHILRHDLSDPDTLFEMSKNVLSENNTICLIIYAETISNPTGRIFAFEAITKIKKFMAHNKIIPARVTIIIDNTWATCVNFNPFDHGAEFVVDSLTKYYSGGSVIAGAIICRDSFKMKYIEKCHRSNGYHISPHDTTMIIEKIDGLENRYKSASDTAIIVISKLMEFGINVEHPVIHTKERAKKFLKFAPPVFSLLIENIPTEKLFEIFERHGFEIKTSYGGKRSRLCNYPRIIEVYPEKFALRIRISIGYENQNADTITTEIIDSLKACRDVFNELSNNKL